MLSEREAQELHELIGAAIENNVPPAQRALELAALVVSDSACGHNDQELTEAGDIRCLECGKVL